MLATTSKEMNLGTFMKQLTEKCIRDKDGRICAWLVGMTDEEVRDFLSAHPGTYISVEVFE